MEETKAMEGNQAERFHIGKPPIPREHGAWAILFTGLLIGVAVSGKGGAQSLLLVASALFVFLARTPVMGIMRDTSDFSSWAWAAIYGALSGLFLVPLLLFFKLYLLIPLGIIGCISFGVHLKLQSDNMDRSIPGEMAGIGGLSLVVPAAYYSSSGVIGAEGLGLWALTLLYFWGSIFHVKLVIALKKPGTKSVRTKKTGSILYHGIALIAAIAMALLKFVPTFAPIALVPVALKAFHTAIFKDPPQKVSIKRVGLLELIHTIIFLAMTIAIYAFTYT